MYIANKHFTMVVCVAMSLLANACSADTSAAKDQPTSEAEQSGKIELASTYDPEADFDPDNLTEAYFLGDWCLAEVVLMGMTDKPNYTYAFLPDGQLLYQNNPDRQTQYGGDWRIEGDRLFVVAASLTGAQALKAMGPNEFVVDSKIVHTFRRGACE